ncbi:MAG: Asp-tRNA(Asn)/Glu-tRNA(Gln) amidotransferase subunit GatA [Desulfovibrionaceae bacterium]|nr:Asp-tRNA(Asn)/Glu-tRNA(Gln) amidotransferase subunit GatA [Desulfovibrionaceae bacterium]
MSDYTLASPSDALLQLSLRNARERLRNRENTSEELVSACLSRIHATEPDLNALITVRDEALEEARQIDKSGIDAKKPLHGIPVTVKDAIVTSGIRTTAGSRILQNFIPFYDAEVVRRLREAGAIIVGKNNMDEFAMGSSTENSSYGPAHNPANTECVPGGSSGGSAASVAAFQCYASLGTDTGGSIRQPAALCGCVGLKPTYGSVSRYGVIAYGSSLDQVGPLTRTVDDAGIMLSVIAGHDAKDSTSSPSAPVVTEDDLSVIASRTDLNGVKIGIPREFLSEGLDEGVAAVCRETELHARDLGAEIREVSLPHATREAIAAYYVIAMAEASSNLSRFDGVRYGYRTEAAEDIDDLYTRSRTEGFGKEVQRRILLGTYVLSAGYYDAYYRKAAQVRRLIREDYLAALEQCDVLLAPVSPVTAWKLGSIVEDPLKMYLMDIFTVSLNLSGLPGLSFPAGRAGGMPVGMQLIGRPFQEKDILSVGHVLETCRR